MHCLYDNYTSLSGKHGVSGEAMTGCVKVEKCTSRKILCGSEVLFIRPANNFYAMSLPKFYNTPRHLYTVYEQSYAQPNTTQRAISWVEHLCIVRTHSYAQWLDYF